MTFERTDRLDSWKAIAAYLGRTEKTARRWERYEGLPVHRLAHASRSSVYAWKGELDEWLAARDRLREEPSGARSPAARLRRIAAVAVVLVFAAIAVLGFRWWQVGQGSIEPVTLAVLPFVVEPQDPGTRHLGPALAATIVDQLAGAPDLRVRPLASSLRYYESGGEPAAIGRRMGVDAVAVGRVHTAGDVLSINVALVDVQTNAQLWGGTRDVTYAELAAFEYEIAAELRERVLRQLHGERRPPGEYRSIRLLSTNAEAMRHYLRAQGFAWNPGEGPVQSAIQDLRTAVELDPDFAAAHALLGVAYTARAFFGRERPAGVMRLAKQHALRAIELDPQAITAYQVLGGVAIWHEFDPPAAERHFDAAIRATPSQAAVYNWYAEYLLSVGRFEEALAASEKAAAIAPGWLEIDTVRGAVHVFGGAAAEAAKTLSAALEREPNHGLSHYFLGQSYLALDRLEDAVASLETANRAMGDIPFSAAALAYAYARAGRRAEAETALAEFERKRAESYYPAFALALVHLGLGDHEGALDWLETAAEEGLLGYHLPAYDPMWASLRGHPRFQRLLEGLHPGETREVQAAGS